MDLLAQDANRWQYFIIITQCNRLLLALWKVCICFFIVTKGGDEACACLVLGIPLYCDFFFFLNEYCNCIF